MEFELVRGSFGGAIYPVQAAIPANVVTSVNGASGAITIPTNLDEQDKNSDFQAHYGTIYYVDASAGPINATLPSLQEEQLSITIVKVDSTDNPVTMVGPVNGQTNRVLTTNESVEVRARGDWFQVV